MGLEVRLIVTEAELCQASIQSGLDQRKNWFMKSVYRDHDVRTMMQSKIHFKMNEWIDKEPEFDNWPMTPVYFTKDKSLRFDKSTCCIV